MIRYNLRCDGGHEAEVWFRSSADYERQQVAGLIECAACGSRDVRRGLMAPAVVGYARPAPENKPAATSRAVAAAPPMPDAMRAVLSRMRDEIEKHCEDVGRRFADEALRMHRGERETRGIYGETTEAEREALADEGVDVARIPWLPRSDA